MERTSTLTFNTILYLSLSPTEKRIILYLRSVKREGLPIFPSRKRIAQKSKCSVEMVRKFFKKNRDLGNILFEKTHRFDQRTKRQTSNLYDLSKPLLRALEWLDIAGLLKAPKKRHSAIISSIEKQENVPPPPPISYPPLVKINLSKDIRFKNTPPNPLKKEYIHPKIDLIKIPNNQKIMLSKYPEAWIIGGIEKTVWSIKRGCKVKNPTDFLWANIRKTGEEFRK